MTVEAGTLRFEELFSPFLCMLRSFHIKYFSQAMMMIITKAFIKYQNTVQGTRFSQP